MSYPYFDITRAVALRSNQLAGGDAAAVETAYTALTLQGVDLPATALKETILAVAAELAEMIGNSANAIFRGPITGETNAIADGDPIPTVDEGGNPFVGSLEGFYDVSQNPPRALTEGTLQEITRYVEDQAQATPFWKINPYKFAYTGTKIRHTGAEVEARGVIWNVGAQAALYGAGNCPLPVAVKMLHVAMVLELLPSENWFVAEAGYYQGIVREKAALIIEGKEQLLELKQIPVKTASADPIKD